ncbi:RNA polymerase sigma factor [Paludisphaera mucosa]|uniref:RNA polymerase sigma factor n=1 Tax=Paludisphaera mucosa TaxID=3030827 RepID=A0ABT6FGW0_9BACT|nr:RNA polymerase sigma factor [Paludisphaera mucosa]MDG3006782.1 RNA polymerase sigma factor [Paludisphaera mucosa]
MTGDAGSIARLLGWGTAAGEDDGRLLERFLAEGDESAFAALVERHGPMVLGVCRRILRDDRDVEDAFQATFLVLVRRAGTIRRRERVGPWIHGVAHRVAARARAVSARRFIREGAGLDAEPPTDAPPFREAERSELRSILDEELGRLPDRLRGPLILCHLEGLTHDEAAARLRQPVGTIRSRLSRGRNRLRDRLARRGVAADDAALGSIVLASPVSPALLESTVHSALAFGTSPVAALALASAGAAALAQGALDAMILTKAKLAAVTLGTILTLGGATGYALQQGAVGKGESSDPKAKESAPPKPDQIRLRRDSIATAQVSIQRLVEERDRLNAEIEEQAQAIALHRSLLDHATGARKPATVPKAEASPPPDIPLNDKDRLRSAGPGLDERRLDVQRLEPEAKSVQLRLELARSEYQAALDVQSGTLETGLNLEESSNGAGGSIKPRKQEATNPGPVPPVVDAPKTAQAVAAGSFVPPAGNSQAKSKSPTKLPPFLVMPDFVIVPSSNGHVLTGYSTKIGVAKTLRIVPEGEADVKVVPIAGHSLAALHITGPAVKRIAAFSSSDGEWHSQDLLEPTEKATPVIGPGAAAYKIGRRVYAFSATANRWDVLEWPEGDDEPSPPDEDSVAGVGGFGSAPQKFPAMSPESITCKTKHQLHIFSVKTGRWTSIKLDEPENLEPIPAP